jgi:hypothetical protein
MALNVVSDNDLINNKKLAFTTFTSCNPTPHPPDEDTGIVDSGSSHLYFAPGAPVMNYYATAPTIRVCVANGTPVHSIPLQVVNWHRLLLCPQPAERAMSWRASHIHSLDWLRLLMPVAECSLRTQPSLHLIGMARLFWKVGAKPPAPNFGAGRSSHKNHRRPTCPKHNSSLGLAHMAPKWKPSMQYAPSSSNWWCSQCHHLRSQSRLPPGVDALPLIRNGLTYPQSQHWSLSTMPAWATRLKTRGTRCCKSGQV